MKNTLAPLPFQKSMLRHSIAASLAMTAGFAGLSGAAFAQDGQRTLEEVVVTARYREESLQVSPLAISAISADELSDREFTDSSDIGLNIPNASFRPAGAAYGNTMTAYIRGIGQNDFNFAFEPGVGVYIDGVYFPTTMGSMMDLMDLERVEVLRGPQGTLFGRGSLGGAIRLVSKQPAGDNTGNIQLTVGEFDRTEVRASYDFAITDTLFARVSGMSKSRDGYQKRIDFACAYPDEVGSLPPVGGNRSSNCQLGTQGGEDVTGYRGALRWAPTPELDVTLTYDEQDDSSEVRATTLLETNIQPPFNVWNSFIQDTYGVSFDERFVPDDPYVSYSTFRDSLTGLQVPPKTALESRGMSATVDYSLVPGHGVTVILSKRKFESNYGNDTDASPLAIQMHHGTQLLESKTAEVRLNGLLMDNALEYTVGGFYYQGDIEDSLRVVFPANLLPLGVPYPELHDGTMVDGLTINEAENKSFFGHVVYDFADRWSLSLGARWSEDAKSSDFDNSIVQAQVDTVDDRWDWKVGLDYQFNEDIMVYGSAASGYRPQAYNPRPFQVTQFVAVDGEEAVSYDLGVKGDFLDNTLRLNATVFYVDYKQRITGAGGTECVANNQGNYVDLVDPGTPGALTDSLGNTCLTTISMTNYINTPGEIEGVELEASWMPIDGLTISGIYGYTGWDSPDISGDDVVVDRPSYVPEFNWSLSATYTIYMDGGAQLTPRLDIYGQDEICTNVTSARSCSPGYELVNGRVQWDSADNTWSAALGMNNLTDELYYYNRADGTAFGQPYVSGQVAPPQEWYLQLRREF